MPNNCQLKTIILILLSVSFCLAASNDGLVAYWKFDKGRGTIVFDASGNGHDGTISNALWTTGKSGYSLDFSGNGSVEIPNSDDLQLKNDFTICAWIKKMVPSIKGKSMGIVAKSASDRWDYDLFMSTSKLEHPAFYSDAFKQPGGDIEVISASPIKFGEWTHVAVTREKERGTIYLNGNLTGSAHLPEQLPTSRQNLYIGYDFDGHFGGCIDEVRIYNRALNDEEIRAIITEDAPLAFRQVIVDTLYGGIRALADINNDGLPDIVHAFWYKGAPLAWYQNLGNFKWEKHIILENFYPCTDDFEVADLDSDGDDDIIIGMSGKKKSNDPKVDGISIENVEIVWFENRGGKENRKLHQWQKHLIGLHSDKSENYVKDIEIADFTNDGKLDVVTRMHESIAIFQQKTPSDWFRIQYIDIHPHEGMDVGDVDCDSDPDIVLNGFWLECPSDPIDGHWKARTIDSKWWTQTGDWTANNCKVCLTDLTGNGCPEVILSHSERAGYPVSWYSAMDLSKDLWQAHVIDTVDFCHTLESADMNGDGYSDIIVGEMLKSDDPDRIIVYKNDGLNENWTKWIVASKSIYSGKVADMDNDGDVDIVSNRNWDQAPLEIWYNLKEDEK